MTRLEEENSVLQVLVCCALTFKTVEVIPVWTAGSEMCRSFSSNITRIMTTVGYHLREGSAVQAARAGDARELAAAQRREQDLSQNNSALKVCPVQRRRGGMWPCASDTPAHGSLSHASVSQHCLALVAWLKPGGPALDRLHAVCYAVMPVQAEVTDLRKQMEELRTQLHRNEEMVRWLNNQVRGD